MYQDHPEFPAHMTYKNRSSEKFEPDQPALTPGSSRNRRLEQEMPAQLLKAMTPLAMRSLNMGSRINVFLGHDTSSVHGTVLNVIHHLDVSFWLARDKVLSAQ